MRMRFREVKENPEWRLKNLIEARLQEERRERIVLKIVNDEDEGVGIMKETYRNGLTNELPDEIDFYSIDDVRIIRGKLCLGVDEIIKILPDDIEEDYGNYEYDADALFVIEQMKRLGYENIHGRFK